MYSKEPRDPKRFTQDFDRLYSRIARAFDLFVKVIPVWSAWLNQALPYLLGPRVLEVSFGTGYLLTQYANRFRVYGIDYNPDLIRIARRNLERSGMAAALGRADVGRLPFPPNSFDTVLNTMAFSGYPDGLLALSEMKRVLKPGGRLVMIDMNFPQDGNWLGTRLIQLWDFSGDVIRNMDPLFKAAGLEYQEREIGGSGSVHLFLAEKSGN